MIRTLMQIIGWRRQQPCAIRCNRGPERLMQPLSSGLQQVLAGLGVLCPLVAVIPPPRACGGIEMLRLESPALGVVRLLIL